MSIHVLLKHAGCNLWNNQCIGSTVKQLQLRSKFLKRRKMVQIHHAKAKPTKLNEAWSMDFVADRLADGTKFRTITIADVFSKEALTTKVGQRLCGGHVAALLIRLAMQ